MRLSAPAASSSPSAAVTVSTPRQSRRDDVRTTRCTPRNPLPPSSSCRRLNDGRLAFRRARTTAGVSTRTARRRVCGPPADSAPSGPPTHVQPRRRSRVDPGAVPNPDNTPSPCSGAPLLRDSAATAGTSTSTAAAACPLATAVRQIRGRATIFTAGPNDSLRQRVDDYLAEHGIELPGRHGHRADAGQGARVRVQSADRVLVPRRRRDVCATSSPRCTIPTADGTPTCSRHTVDRPRDSTQAAVRVAVQRSRRLLPGPRTAAEHRTGCAISLHRDNQPAFVATMRGTAAKRHHPRAPRAPARGSRSRR